MTEQKKAYSDTINSLINELLDERTTIDHPERAGFILDNLAAIAKLKGEQPITEPLNFDAIYASIAIGYSMRAENEQRGSMKENPAAELYTQLSNYFKNKSGYFHNSTPLDKSEPSKVN